MSFIDLKLRIFSFKLNNQQLIIKCKEKNAISLSFLKKYKDEFQQSDLYSSILDATSFLPLNVNIEHRIKAILQDVHTLPSCPICKKACCEIVSDLKLSSNFTQKTCNSNSCKMTYMSRKRTTTKQSRENHSIAMKKHKKMLLHQYQELLNAYHSNSYKLVSLESMKHFICHIFNNQKKNGLVVREKMYFENVNELASILGLTKFIDVPKRISKVNEFNFIERMHCIINDIHQRPKCQFCKCQEVKFIPGKRRYAESCAKCEMDKSRKTKGLKTSTEIVQVIEDAGYEVVQFPNKLVNNGKLIIKCNKCGKTSEHRIFNGRMQHLEQICLCNYCDKYASNPEKEIRQIVQQLVPDEHLIFNDRSIIAPYELDIVLPKRKIAFEFNGFYWHNEKRHRPSYHVTKTIKCNKVGYQLFQIFENEWTMKKQQVIGQLRNILNVNEMKISINNCQIKKIASIDAYKFFDSNSLFEYVHSSINIGVYNNEQLVYAMSFAKSKHDKSIQHELTQFCNKINVEVKDAFQSCLDFFENSYRSKSIVLYLDRRWSGNGKCFLDHAWKLIKKTYPVGQYYKNESLKQLISPMKLTSKFMKENLEKFNPTKSKQENMYINGYIRIFDCGQLVFIKTF